MIADTHTRMHIQHNTLHPACLRTVPNKHQMAFLFLDGEACQRCRGTGEGGREWEWKSARWRGPHLAKRITSLRLASTSPFSTPQVTFTGIEAAKRLSFSSSQCEDVLFCVQYNREDCTHSQCRSAVQCRLAKGGFSCYIIIMNHMGGSWSW